MRIGPATSPVESERPGRPVWVWLALAALGGWTIFLTVQTIRTANPIVVSVPQILSSKYVVVGDRASSPDRFTARQVLRGEPLLSPKELSVIDLESAIRTAGDFSQYVLPLEPTGEGSYRVTAIPLDGVARAVENPRPIYPWNDAVKAQIERALTPAVIEAGVKRDG